MLSHNRFFVLETWRPRRGLVCATVTIAEELTQSEMGTSEPMEPRILHHSDCFTLSRCINRPGGPLSQGSTIRNHRVFLNPGTIKTTLSHILRESNLGVSILRPHADHHFLRGVCKAT